MIKNKDKLNCYKLILTALHFNINAMRRNFVSRLALLCIIFLSGIAGANAQKVANYAVGQYGKPNYEHFSFWTKAGKRAQIAYTQGKYGEDKPVKYLGKAAYEGKAAFRVQLPNGTILYVIPSGINLKVQSATKSYSKTFAWAYEGPVDGRGTFCSECAEDEKDAMKLLRAYYLK